MVYIDLVKTLKSLARYLEEITGESLAFEDTSPSDTLGLPLYLRSAYELKPTSLFGKPVVLAFQKEQVENATPSEYVAHARQLRSATNQTAVLILPQLAAYARNRLVRQGVPFIVPNRQLFVPGMMVDLREHFPKPSTKDSKGLSAPSQLVLLYHLHGNVIEGVSLREVAARLSYSPMTLSNVRDELEAHGLCEVVQEGRSRHLKFGQSRKRTWDQAVLFMRSPVKADHWVRWRSTREGAIRSATSALATYTMLGEDPIPTYAMREGEYRSRLEKGNLHGCPGPDDADARVETWRYDPALLSKGETVDRLSLYLSLSSCEDERVQKALAGLLGAFPW